jgi:hypothetical protein
MISETEILHIVNEIHQYDVVLVELRDGAIFGIAKGAASTPIYFRTRELARTPQDRRALLQAVLESRGRGNVDSVTLDTLLNGLRGMKTRHVWLERRTEPRQEMAFLNLKELEIFLRKHEA